MSCGVYKIINPKGRIYIGQSINIEGRWKSYFNIRCSNQPKLYNSLRKYGSEMHIFEIIEECNAENLLVRETFWKLFYNVLNVDSLCCRIDGKGGNLSKETRQRISEVSLGKMFKHTSPRNKNIDGSVKLSSEQQRSNQPNCKAILQYDLDRNFIKEWPSVSLIKKTLNIHINGCLTGKLKSCAGYIWEYKDKNNLEIEFKRNKSVAQYDLANNIIAIFKSLQDAATLLNLSSGSISAVCNQKLYSTGGFKWKFIENIPDHLKSLIINLPIVPEIKKEIYQFDMIGNLIHIFNTKSELTEFLITTNICKFSNVVSALSGRSCAAGNYLWSYNFPLKPNKINKTKKTVQQYSNSGELIKEFDCVQSAMLETGIKNIYYQIYKGFDKNAKFSWKYKDLINVEN